MADENASGMTLKQLKLRPGLLLQVQPGGFGANSFEAQFVAALVGKGLMIAPHGTDRALTVGGNYCVRGFTGQYDFSFSSRVLKNFTQPFAYALFHYPETIEARLVRKAMRIKTQLAAILKTAAAGELRVRLLDLSAAGALILSTESPGPLLQMVGLDFYVDSEGERTLMRIPSRIAHSTEGNEGFRTGVMFEGLTRDDKLRLQCYVNSLVDEESEIRLPGD